MQTVIAHETLSPLIQASLSPVFLLSAIGVTLSVIDTRQNRIVDRMRVLEAQILSGAWPGTRLEVELSFYLDRARKIGWATSCCTLSALCVVLAVVTLFVDAQTRVTLAVVIEGTFTSAVVLYGAALVLFLRDVLLVNRGLMFLYERAVATQPDADKL